MQRWFPPPSSFVIGAYVFIIHWKVFEKGMKIHMMLHIKECYLTTYHILLAKLGELSIELFALELSMGF